MKLFSPTRWTGSASLLSTTLKNRSADITVVFKAKQKAIDMDFPPSFFDAMMDTTNWDDVALWEPVISTVAFITAYLQADTTPLSAVHASFESLEAALSPSSGRAGEHAEMVSIIKAR